MDGEGGLFIETTELVFVNQSHKDYFANAFTIHPFMLSCYFFFLYFYLDSWRSGTFWYLKRGVNNKLLMKIKKLNLIFKLVKSMKDEFYY